MALATWPKTFLAVVGEELIRSPGYLVSIAPDGRIACKACGKFLPVGNAEKHFQEHLAELEAYLGRDRYYDDPCEECGEKIPHTGKPGRPPRLCDSCKYPMQGAASEILDEYVNEYTPEEQEILDEFV